MLRSALSFRAICLGVLLAILVCSFTYYNNQILRQTYFVAHHLPVGVFGVLVGLLLVINPLLEKLKRGLSFGGGELAVALTLGLSVCSWPFVGGFRTLTTVPSMPTHQNKVQPSWQAAEVMSYVPGGSPRVAEGFVKDFAELRARLKAGLAGRGSTLLVALLNGLDEPSRTELESILAGPFEGTQKRRLLRLLNQAWIEADVAPALGSVSGRAQAQRARWQAALQHARAPVADAGDAHSARLAKANHGTRLAQAERERQRLQRILLEDALPGIISPTPGGRGVLLLDGVDDSFALGTLVTGWGGHDALGLFELPWQAWLPTLTLWGGLALCLVACMLCLALIVHPQWSSRELLPYPIVGFFSELTAPGKSGGLPAAFQSKLFWIGFCSVAWLNLENGLHAWFPAVPEIPKALDFSPLRVLFPSLSGVEWTAVLLFQFTLYPIVIAFTYFVRSDVGLSVGLSHILWSSATAMLTANGVALQGGDINWQAGPLVGYGAAVGLTLFIVYAGRRYYLLVLGAACGIKQGQEAPETSVWALRGLALGVLGAVLLLTQLAGLSWIFALFIVGALLMGALVMARVNAEAGLFMYSPAFAPLQLIPIFFGYQALAPTQYLAMSMVRWTLWADPRGSAMPFFSNGLAAVDRIAKLPVRKLAGGMAGLMLLGFFLCLGVTLYLQYNASANPQDIWGRTEWPKQPFDQTSRQIAGLVSEGQLAEAVNGGVWERLATAQLDGELFGFFAAGFVLVLVLALLRTRVPGWPLHPVLMVVITVWQVMILAPSVLLGWAIRALVVQVGGMRGYAQLKPLMIGVIAGELLSALGWIVVGAVYYWVTGLAPAQFSVFVN